MPQLQSYWPSEQNVTACILTEAESLADSQLLAVHEPMRLDRIEFQSGKVTQVGEGALLDFLLEHNRPLPLIWRFWRGEIPLGTLGSCSAQTS